MANKRTDVSAVILFSLKPDKNKSWLDKRDVPPRDRIFDWSEVRKKRGHSNEQPLEEKSGVPSGI